MSDEYLFTHRTGNVLTYSGEDEPDFEDDDFDPSEAETVTRDDHWTDFFDSKDFVQFEATVAQPIVQPYVYDGQIKKFRKDEDELRRSQAQLDNLPWTMGHPPRDRVTNANQIRGFWSEPHWQDGQRATLNIPVTDTDAVRYAVTNDEVSVGFGGTLDWVDDDTAEYDAVQRDMAYDHVASVENGRCPPEKGCGLHTDGTDSASTQTSHGHVWTDAIRTESTEEGSVTNESDFDVGDWVSFTRDGTRVHGQLAMVDSERALVKEYDPESDTLSDDSITVATSNLSEWVGPHADSCEGVCHCGCHDSPFVDQAPDGIHVEDGDWFGIAPDENPDDEPKYELNNCNDVKDAFNLRNNGDYDVDVSTLVSRIKRAAQAHDCPSEQRPWTDSAYKLARYIAQA